MPTTRPTARPPTRTPRRPRPLQALRPFHADLAYLPGPILGAVSANQAIAGVGAVLLMALALAAVVHGEQTRLRQLEPDALLVLGTWLVLLLAIYAVPA